MEEELHNVTESELKRIAPSGSTRILSGMASAVRAYGPEFIHTDLQLAHFLSQTAHESDGFKTLREYWGPTAAQKKYEGRKDLGNTQKGDGRRFAGHGVMQVTGRSNHRQFTLWARRRWPDAPDFEKDPEALAADPWAYVAAFWYWDTRKINALIKGDDQDITRVTKKINGGLNGITDRRTYLRRALEVMRIDDDKVEKPKAVEGMLQEGDVGPMVRALQEDLKKLGFYRGNVDDIYGPNTTIAVIWLQRERGLKQDGIAGPKVFESLRTDRSPAPISEERRSATVETLREKGSVVVKETDTAKTMAKVATVAAGGFGVKEAATGTPEPTSTATQLSETADRALEQASRARDWVDTITDVGTWAIAKLGSVGAWIISHPTILVLAVIGIGIWWRTNRAQDARVRMYQRGEG